MLSDWHFLICFFVVPVNLLHSWLCVTYGDIRIGMEYTLVMKKRTTVWLPDKLLIKLKRVSAKTGAPMAELFRRAVEAYLKKF